ncbi:hypothetical protein B7O34_13530, partial [Corynebacterium striatum]|nr:hypothetical protein [Corynebacterium striatum]
MTLLIGLKPMKMRMAMEEALLWKEMLLALEKELEALSQAHLEEVRRRKLYIGTRVSERELHQASAVLFRTILHRLLNGRDSQASYAQKLNAALCKIARTRARQGVNLEELSVVVRANFIVLWRALNERAEDGQILVQFLEELYEEVEVAALEIRTEYMAERALIEGDNNLIVRRILDELFASEDLDESQIGRLAEAIGTEIQREYCVLIAPMSAATKAEDIAEELMTEGRAFWLYFNNSFCIFWAKAFGATPEAMVSMLHLENEWCLVNAHVYGLQNLRKQAIGLTRIAAATKFGQGAHAAGAKRLSFVEDLLPVVLARYAEEVLPGYLSVPLEELLGVGEKERDQLVETVDAYLRTGSVKATSEQTYCHRNTVINRLKSFESCTGLSPLTIEDAGRIRMLLAILPLHL